MQEGYCNGRVNSICCGYTIYNFGTEAKELKEYQLTRSRYSYAKIIKTAVNREY